MRLSPWSRDFWACFARFWCLRLMRNIIAAALYAHQSQTAAHSITQLARFEPYVAQHKPETVIDVILWKPSLQKPN